MGIDNKKIVDELNESTSSSSSSSSSTSIKHVIDKVLIRSTNTTTISPNLKSSKKPKKTILDNKKDSEDLFEQPDQLETNVSSTISYLIESKKKLFNQVQIELDKSSNKKIGIINLQNDIKTLEIEKEEAIKRIKDAEDGIINRIEKTVSFDRELRSRLSSIESVINIIEYFEHYNHLLQQYQQEIKSQQFISATNTFIKMSDWFNQSNNQPYELSMILSAPTQQPRIIPSIKDQLKKRKNQLKSTLLESFTNSIIITSNFEIQLFQIENNNKKYQSSSSSSQSYTVDLIQSLELLGLFNHTITSFTSTLFQSFLQPIIKKLNSLVQDDNYFINKINKQQQQQRNLYKEEEIDNGELICFKFCENDDNNNNNNIGKIITIPMIYEFIIKLFEFLKRNLFGSSNEEIIKKFGQEIWSDLSQCILDELLKYRIPKDINQLNQYHSTIKNSTIDFESKITNDILFLTNNNNIINSSLSSSSSSSKIIKTNQLTEFVNNIEFHYSERKRMLLLSKAREIILKDRYQSIQSNNSNTSGGNQSMIGKKVFGVPIEKTVSGNNEIPAVVLQTIDYIEKKAMDIVGIFRLSGSVLTIEQWKAKYDKGEKVDLFQEVDPHAVAGLLKLYLRELPDPLLTYEKYDNFIAAQSIDDFPSRIKLIKHLVKSLPPVNYAVLSYLMAFVGKVATHSAANKMQVHNLSTVFGPNLIKDRQDSGDYGNNVQVLVEDTPIINALALSLIRDYQYIFTDKEIPEQKILAKSLYEYAGNDDGTTSEDDKDLLFPKGATIKVTQQGTDGWWTGEYQGKQGKFPASYVELLPHSPSTLLRTKSNSNLTKKKKFMLEMESTKTKNQEIDKNIKQLEITKKELESTINDLENEKAALENDPTIKAMMNLLANAKTNKDIAMIPKNIDVLFQKFEEYKSSHEALATTKTTLIDEYEQFNNNPKKRLDTKEKEQIQQKYDNLSIIIDKSQKIRSKSINSKKIINDDLVELKKIFSL